MENWTPINYRGYWDIPRTFVARHRSRTFLFECLFDQELDDYPDSFQVYLMPDLRDDQLPNDWTTLSAQAKAHLGDVPISRVRFDATRRHGIDSTILDELCTQKLAS